MCFGGRSMLPATANRLGFGLFTDNLRLTTSAITAAADPNCMAATVTERPAAFVSFRRH